MLAAALALLASFSWGTSDFLAGVESRRSTAWTAALGGQVVASLSLIALLIVVTPAQPSLGALAAPLAGGAVGGVGVLLQYRALSLVDMSVVSPIIAGAALVPVLWGTAIGERPSPLQVLGIVVTLAGIVLIARRAPGGATTSESLDRTGILVAVAAVVALVIRLRRRALPALLVVGLLIVAANILFTSATTFGYLSIVGVLGWLNPAVTMVWARLALHERLRPLQMGAAVLVFVGIVCLALG